MTAPVRDQEWRNQAACASSGRPELWDDSIDGETWAQRQERHAKAKAVCRSCPVVAACRAARRPWEQGVWGGVAYVRNKKVWGDIHAVDTPSNTRAKAALTCENGRSPEGAVNTPGPLGTDHPIAAEGGHPWAT